MLFLSRAFFISCVSFAFRPTSVLVKMQAVVEEKLKVPTSSVRVRLEFSQLFAAVMKQPVSVQAAVEGGAVMGTDEF